jgi:melibiose permease
MLINNRPSWSEKLGYGLGAVGKDMVYILVSVFYLLYLDQVLVLPLSFITTAFFLIRIVDALDDVIIGWFFDRFYCRFGKFKPALLCGGIGAAILTVLMFNVPSLEGLALYAYIIVTYLLWTLFYSIHDIAFWGLIPTFGTDSATRERMTAIPRAGAIVGSQLMLLGGLPALYLLRTKYNFTHDYFTLFAVIIACIFIASIMLTILSITDRTRDRPRKNISLQKLGELVCHNDQLIVIALISFLQQLILLTINSSLILFFFTKSPNISLASDFLLPGAIAGFLGFSLYRNCCQVFSRRFVIICSFVLMAAGYTLMIFTNPQQYGNFNLFTIAYCVSGLGMAWSIASTTVMSSDCVDYGEFRHNIRTEGIVFALQTASAKLGLAVALMISDFSFNIVSVLLSQIKQPSYLLSVRFILVIGVILSILMLIIYLTKYRLHGDFFQNILNTVELFKTQNDNFIKKSSTFPLRYALDNEAVIWNLKAESVDEVLSQMADRLYKVSAISSKKDYLEMIRLKMQENPAGIAEGIAIPHARGPGIRRMALAVATLEKALDFGAPDGKKCDLIFMLATPDDHVSHLNLLGQLSVILNIPGFADKLRSAGSSLEITDRILKCEKQLKS